MSEFKIEVENLSTGYITRSGIKTIQKNVTAHLSGGEFTCLLGPNGAGKTTLLRTLSGFLPPIGGSVYVDGIDIKIYKETDLSKLIGVVLTERPSVSSMTVEQLVALGRSPYTGFWGRLTDRDHRIVEDAIAATRAESLRTRLVDTLSDGERQRVMIAKALAQETPAIFLDEPTAFLDFPSKAEMMILLRNLAHSQKKVIFQSTHDINMALALADRIWLVDKQLGTHIGTPRELADNGILQKYFERSGIEFNAETLTFSIARNL